MSDDKSASNTQQFDVQRIYLKDVSLETPNSPMIFTEPWQPEINLQINNSSRQLSEDVHEVALTLTVTARLGEKTAYLAEVQQAGIFTLKGFASEPMSAMLGAFCPNILFPFAREAVASLVTKGGFPALLLNPVNFDALYVQHMQAKKEQAAGQAGA